MEVGVGVGGGVRISSCTEEKEPRQKRAQADKALIKRKAIYHLKGNGLLPREKKDQAGCR